MKTAYQAQYYALELSKRSSSDSLDKLSQTLFDAQVDLNPHQIDAALFAFRSPLSKGAILADEVGLGKTIEAGLVIAQKWAERKRKILIIAPSSLRKQWNQELSDKFYLPSEILEGPIFSKALKSGQGNPFVSEQIVICSYHFASSKANYIKRVTWDLVIMDEAHRLRNVYKPDNQIANNIKKALKDFPKLLLTATPLQNSLLELFGLVSIVDEHVFGDQKSFRGQFLRQGADSQFEDLRLRLKGICQRTLRRQVLEYIRYTNRIAITQEFYPNADEQNLYNQVTSYLQKDRLFALPSGQRHLMTLILHKLLASSTFAITGTLEGLGKKLEKLLSSSEETEFTARLNLDLEDFESTKDEWEEPEEEPQKVELSPEEIELVQQEIKELASYFKLSQGIQRNAKGDVLLTALKRGFTEAQRLGSQRKAIIFTESRRTQDYLLSILEDTEYKGRIVLFNGDNQEPAARNIYQQWIKKHEGSDRISGAKTADTRAALVDYFRDEADIMIATEAAAEGINLQFCSIVVNYDLPWNPQRIEQRIGRCHRYGQQHDVVVVNFLNKTNEADQRVYQLLDQKFQLFSGVFGASDEVLGSLESGVDFEKRIARIYQTCRSPDQIQSSFDELQKEMEQQIQARMSSTRQTLLENFDEEVHEKLRSNLVTGRENLNKIEAWLWEMTRFSLSANAEFNESDHSFRLHQNPITASIPLGTYAMHPSSQQEAIKYRIAHPLAQSLLERWNNTQLEPTQLHFAYSTANRKISILDGMVGQSGWMSLSKMTIHSFEPEDHLIFTATTGVGEILDGEQCQRLFSLETKSMPLAQQPTNAEQLKLNQLQAQQQKVILQENSERNARFFDDEMNKLDRWAEDVKVSLEMALKDLEIEIKTLRSESKKLMDLQQKVQTQRKIKDLEKKRSDMRMNLYQSQDEIDAQKETLLSDIEQRLQQKVEFKELFLVNWHVE